MPPMGRRRKDTTSTLEPRVYQRRGAFYYVHRLSGKWEHLGTDQAAANHMQRLFCGEEIDMADQRPTTEAKGPRRGPA